MLALARLAIESMTWVLGDCLIWHHKWWWLTPMILVLLLVGGLVIFAQSSAIAPFIYTLF